jgi:hypothetical protein
LKKSWVVVGLFLIFSILVAAFAFQSFSFDERLKQKQCYVGVAFCGNTTAEAKMLIDRVKEYSNLFILQSGPISTNETAINEICNYAVAAKLNLIVYFGDLDPVILAKKNLMWRTSWVNSAQERWGEQFLGVYYYDEPGGIYLDTDKNTTQWHQPPNSTYESEAARFTNGLLTDSGTVGLKAKYIPMYTSDYGLYWFDYLAGYDVVLAQAGWNHSLIQDIALLRGASTLQNKDWGIMVTWKYTVQPYLASGEEIYSQMVSAYQAGAKYISIFNYPYSEGSAFGTMKDEHFAALEKFWNNIIHGSKNIQGSIKAEAALVLPKDYGWGMRNPKDKIWGYWGPDELSSQIWTLSRILIAQYGFSLDIVYDDPVFPLEKGYSHIYYWNSTMSD